jgi:mono/diheme cytochrome c family protein
MPQAFLSVVAGVALVLTGCGKEDAPDQEFEGRGLRYMPDMYYTQSLKSQEGYVVEETTKRTGDDGLPVTETTQRIVPAMMAFPEGAVSRDFMPYPIRDALDPVGLEEANALLNPLQATPKVLLRGQDRYNTFCAPCHGRDGNVKNAYVTEVSGAPSINTDGVRDKTDGELYHIITLGRNRMPNYRAQLPPEDRWAVVHYMRALKAATDADGSDKNRLLELERDGAADDFAPALPPVPEYNRYYRAKDLPTRGVE